MSQPKFTESVSYRGLTFLTQQLLEMIDSGAHDDVAVPQALEHIREGDLFAWLKSLDAGRDFSAFGVNGPYREATAGHAQNENAARRRRSL